MDSICSSVSPGQYAITHPPMVISSRSCNKRVHVEISSASTRNHGELIHGPERWILYYAATQTWVTGVRGHGASVDRAAGQGRGRAARVTLDWRPDWRHSD